MDNISKGPHMKKNVQFHESVDTVAMRNNSKMPARSPVDTVAMRNNSKIPARSQHHPDDSTKMIESMLPHLSMGNPEDVYIISGPFQHNDPTHGINSNVLRVTSLPRGATVIAVPSLPAYGPRSLVPNFMPCEQPAPNTGQMQAPAPHVGQMHTPAPHVGQMQAPILSPQPPHVMCWSMHQPQGYSVPLRQPTPAVYYNQPSNSCYSSGILTPNSDVQSEDSGFRSLDSAEIVTGPNTFQPAYWNLAKQ